MQHFDENYVLNLEVTSEICQKYQSFRLPCLQDDYKEVVKLALIYIGLQPSQGFTLQRPGAVSKARWMSNVIYTLKIVFFTTELIKNNFRHHLFKKTDTFD